MTETRGIPEEERAGAVAEVERRFGGIDVPASLAGTLTAVGALIVIGWLLAAVFGAFGCGVDPDALGAQQTTTAGLVAGAIALLAAFMMAAGPRRGWPATRAG